MAGQETEHRSGCLICGAEIEYFGGARDGVRRLWRDLPSGRVVHERPLRLRSMPRRSGGGVDRNAGDRGGDGRPVRAGRDAHAEPLGQDARPGAPFPGADRPALVLLPPDRAPRRESGQNPGGPTTSRARSRRVVRPLRRVRGRRRRRRVCEPGHRSDAARGSRVAPEQPGDRRGPSGDRPARRTAVLQARHAARHRVRRGVSRKALVGEAPVPCPRSRGHAHQPRRFPSSSGPATGSESRSKTSGSSSPVAHARQLDQGQSSGTVTRPRRTGFAWTYSIFS